MITLLKEAEVTGKAIFIPSPENLKQLSDAALEIGTDAAEKIDKLKEALDMAVLAIVDLQEKLDKEVKNERN